jgi:hypothetical protein
MVYAYNMVSLQQTEVRKWESDINPKKGESSKVKTMAYE